MPPALQPIKSVEVASVCVVALIKVNWPETPAGSFTVTLPLFRTPVTRMVVDWYSVTPNVYELTPVMLIVVTVPKHASR